MRAKHLAILSSLILVTLISAGAQTADTSAGAYTPSAENLKNREDFSRERFGIFIHWGIYSMLGHGEWVMQNEDLNYQEYPRLAAGFYPSRFDASEWVELFKKSGAGYITVTTRHHDGFSMFHTAQSDYNIVDATPFRRDVIAELSQACQKEGLSLHLYYSHLDWGRTDYYPRGRTGLGTGRPEGAQGDWRHYMDFVNAQLTELLTNYGPVRAIWFDGVWDRDDRPREEQPGIWNLEEQYKLIHSLQSGCLIGNNHHLLPFEGEDIQIFERDIPGFNEYGLSGQEISPLPLETCQTMNRSWGYRIKDTDYKSVDFLIEYLVRTAAKGANLLLNVGPRPDGSIPEQAAERLLAMGEWLARYGESIYGTQAGPIQDEEWGVSTSRDNFIYVHVLNREAEKVSFSLEGRKLKSASLLNSGETLSFEGRKGAYSLSVPAIKEGEGPDRIIKLTFNK